MLVSLSTGKIGVLKSTSSCKIWAKTKTKRNYTLQAPKPIKQRKNKMPNLKDAYKRAKENNKKD